MARTPAEIKARLAELENQMAEEAANTIDPTLIKKAEQFLQFSVNDVKIAFDVMGIVPTEEQAALIEEKLIEAKLEQLSKSVIRADSATKAKWA